jgi:catechol 2,3-dioxygenase-like lactoylglutathione lyase family enzyme
MFKGTRILLWSPNPDKLMEFYRDVLELKLEEKTDIPEKDGISADYGYIMLLKK